MRWTVGFKIGAGFAAIAAIFLAVGSLSYFNFGKMTYTVDWVTHTYKVLGELSGLSQAMADAERGERGYIITSDETFLNTYRLGIDAAQPHLSAVRTLTQDNPIQQERLDRLEPMIEEREATLAEVLSVAQAKGEQAARDAIVAAKSQQKMEDIDKIISDMRDEESSLLTTRTDEAQNSAFIAKVVIVIGVLSAILFASVIGFVVARGISRPLRQMTFAAQRVTAGDLSFNSSADHRGDEVGQLRNAFGAMVVNLRQMVETMVKGMNTLSTSANQISTTTTQFASSSAQTATAVTETTTTVEEVRQTAQLANQKSKYVSDSTHKAAQTAQAGKQSLETTVAEIQSIRRQMESIADGMVRLSEQNKTIGQIITSVDDLAAQSNILAVNAAIEAAKAGEHGKGFSVVAQEVRSLAEQSKQATNQVRNILGEIQKATNSAVMFTEQGSKAVEVGVSQAGETSKSMVTLSASVTEAAQAATQIAASSQQQLVGMDQVAVAMESIKQASSQNVASAKQLESAAFSLKELGQQVKQTVDRYKL